MATLEGAAEQLLVKLRGLDSEVEGSQRKLQGLTERVGEVARDVEKDWSGLAEAAESLMNKLREEQEKLQEQALQTGQASTEAQEAVAEEGARARSETEASRAALDRLAQHASGLEPGVESLAVDAGQAPARALAERARELQQELSGLIDQARDFLRGDVVPAVEQLADEIREAYEATRRLLADEAATALQETFDEWESKVDGLEDYVTTQGYQASHRHARDVVEYALECCLAASREELEDLQPCVNVLVAQLGELVEGVERSAEGLVTKAGAELIGELAGVHTSAASAVAALDRVGQQLSSYSFVEV